VQETSQVTLRTKATNIAIAKELQGMLSYSNQLKVSIQAIEMGSLLCSVKLLFEDTVLESIITADSAKRMQLKVGENVTALIKSSDLAIAELLS
jgi:molybdopterin-binding protein